MPVPQGRMFDFLLRPKNGDIVQARQICLDLLTRFAVIGDTVDPAGIEISSAVGNGVSRQLQNILIQEFGSLPPTIAS